MKNLTAGFQELFNKSDNLRGFFCPGRVNLIGEHIDYLGGLVLPAAISLGITALIRENDTREIKVYSSDYKVFATLNLDSLPSHKQNHWSDFILGVILNLQAKGVLISGCDILLSSSLPKASGLSSSAALEVLVYYMFSKMRTDLEPNRVQMALDCQKIENEFIGVNCGIMDQFAVANGKKSTAILLNCDSLEHQTVPLKLSEYSILIANSNKPRELAESAYNLRIKECSESLDILRSHRKIENLVDAREEDLSLIDDPILQKRTRHAYTENERVKEAVKSLNKSDLNSFGKLMHASHLSLQNDFEVSCSELNHIVEALMSEPSCLGARMTGAGFGGCCVALVKTESVDAVSQKVASSYTKAFGFAPSFYPCIPSDGVHEIAL